MSRPSGKPFAAAMNDKSVMVKLPRSEGHGHSTAVDATELVRDTASFHPVLILFGAKHLIAPG